MSFFKYPERKIALIYLVVTMLLLVHTALLLLWSNKKYGSKVKWLFLGVIVCELAFTSYSSVNAIGEPRVAEVSGRKGYNDYTPGSSQLS